MRKIREILRLHWEQKLGQRQIARGASVSQSTVHEYLARRGGGIKVAAAGRVG
jgi:DNA-binding transcriptional regulator LsrR (DeoR family)